MPAPAARDGLASEDEALLKEIERAIRANPVAFRAGGSRLDADAAAHACLARHPGIARAPISPTARLTITARDLAGLGPHYDRETAQALCIAVWLHCDPEAQEIEPRLTEFQSMPWWLDDEEAAAGSRYMLELPAKVMNAARRAVERLQVLGEWPGSEISPNSANSTSSRRDRALVRQGEAAERSGLLRPALQISDERGEVGFLPVRHAWLPAEDGSTGPVLRAFIPVRRADGSEHKLFTNLDGSIPFRRADGTTDRIEPGYVSAHENPPAEGQQAAPQAGTTAPKSVDPLPTSAAPTLPPERDVLDPRPPPESYTLAAWSRAQAEGHGIKDPKEQWRHLYENGASVYQEAGKALPAQETWITYCRKFDLLMRKRQ